MECSEELGDMVKAADPTLALSGTELVFEEYKPSLLIHSGGST